MTKALLYRYAVRCYVMTVGHYYVSKVADVKYYGISINGYNMNKYVLFSV